MTSNHTPGPWDYLDIGEIVGGADMSVTIALINEGDASPLVAECEANARLIAAAPELLAVLVAIREQLVKQDINFGPLIADAADAISKATA